jgi:hypothetical protein
MVATEWRGAEHMADGSRAGQVLIAQAPSAGTGWPYASTMRPLPGQRRRQYP